MRLYQQIERSFSDAAHVVSIWDEHENPRTIRRYFVIIINQTREQTQRYLEEPQNIRNHYRDNRERGSHDPSYRLMRHENRRLTILALVLAHILGSERNEGEEKHLLV